jgi:hypothetical protein
MAGPEANYLPQLVGLLLQLAHALCLNSEIAAEFRDLTLDNTCQFGWSRPPESV